MFLGCPLAKLLPTSNFQYILGQELSSISILSIFKIIKKQVIELKKKKIYLSSFFIDWKNDKIGEVDEHNLFQICVTYGSTIGSENIVQTKELFYL